MDIRIKTLPRVAGVVFGSLLLAVNSLPVFAQDDDEAAALERVEITGSRIRQTDVEGVSPIVTLSREDILRTGLTSIGDLLQRLTISGSALNTQFNSSGNFGFPPDGSGIGAGSTQVDLRHLGAQRVLVLVDGLRWVKESSASGVGGTTDLNTIPLSIVERVEILKDGASAIYGSDAIAGVINIITRKDFQGLEANAYYGIYDENDDGETVQFDVSFGNRSEKSSVFFNISHTQQGEVKANDREQAQIPTPGTGLTRGSSGTPQGRFLFIQPGLGFGAPACVDIDNDGDGINDSSQCNLTTPRGSVFANDIPAFPGDFIGFTNDERFNFSQFNLVLTPNERNSIYGQAIFEVNDYFNVYTKALYNKRKSTNQAAPEPIFIGPGAGTGGLPDTIGVDVTNPFNPFGVTLDAADPNFIFIGRRPIEIGPRIFDQDVDTYYVATGLEGSFDAAGRSFFWNLNAVYSENNATQIKQNAINARALKLALGPLVDCQADTACVPFNIFGGQNGNDISRFGGGGTITRRMRDFVEFVQKDTSEQTLQIYSANLTGDIVDLPGGPLSFAAGFETRTEKGSFQPDPIVVAGDSNGIPAKPTSGSFDVDEIYAEFNVPLVSGKPGAEQLDITVAARSSDYSTFGSETTTKFGIRYRPTREWLIRGSIAEGLRAPTVGELFGSQTRFDAVLTDPCSAPIANATLSANCATLGVPATFVQANPQISVFTGGNALLQPETSDTVTVGIIYSPTWTDNVSWADRLDFEITYYDIELDGAIQAVDAQTQLDSCVLTLDPAFCSGINRNASGTIAGFNNTLTNIGGIDTKGWDFNVLYATPATSIGRFGVSWYNTFVDEFTETLVDPTTASGFTQRSLEGIEVNDSAIPEFQSSLIVDWENGPWTAAWTLRHIGDVEESCSDFLDGTSNSFTQLGLCSNPNTADETLSINKLGSTTFHDIQATYHFSNLNLNVTAGINNAFDKQPPICLSCSLNGYDASSYDIPGGRFVYFRASVALD